ncbi:N-acetylmuramoyl-L-alanine amidase [Gracilibacillus ureilyticus]|uniref:Spore cortex-lytic enzyme n=1 Tax=Gracilibacillus ureilyticus TaxID=531814 RepID=A0A1H9LQW6_9BACI|nr:spore cortex-lytic enzyme [Gracilibacillus ureilyticus]SER13902.1 N-acetylmuramoyl-L-alanine amidase [Gracilibacillus ureilyticus]
MNYLKIGVIAFLLLTIPFFFAEKNQVDAFTDQVIQHGATGEDVIELQARLQYLGFYNGEIDGVFGWGTYWALRNFQYEFGLEIDGLAGEGTKQKLAAASEYDRQFVKQQIQSGNRFSHYGGVDNKKQSQQNTNQNRPAEQNNQQNQGNQQQTQTPAENDTVAELEPTAVNVPQGFSQNDIKLMANAVYGEARGEPYEGQVAVAAVILNRVESPTFPNTVSGVIFEPRAFTAVSDGQIWLTPNDTARRAVLDAINGWDPTGEATYYFNPNTATSGWIWSRPQIKQIGKHIFCM